MQKHNLPSMLTVVAWSFLLGGIVALVVAIIGWSRHTPILDLNALGIFVFFGLRRLSRGWRLYALICASLGVLRFAASCHLDFAAAQSAALAALQPAASGG